MGAHAPIALLLCVCVCVCVCVTIKVVTCAHRCMLTHARLHTNNKDARQIDFYEEELGEEDPVELDSSPTL